MGSSPVDGLWSTATQRMMPPAWKNDRLARNDGYPRRLVDDSRAAASAGRRIDADDSTALAPHGPGRDKGMPLLEFLVAMRYALEDRC